LTTGIASTIAFFIPILTWCHGYSSP
jgi:hypothetical protein